MVQGLRRGIGTEFAVGFAASMRDAHAKRAVIAGLPSNVGFQRSEPGKLPKGSLPVGDPRPPKAGVPLPPLALTDEVSPDDSGPVTLRVEQGL